MEVVIKLYCDKYDKNTEWKEVVLIDSEGNKYQAYQCKCPDGTRICQEDKNFVDIGGAKAREAGIKIGNALANMVIAIYK